MTRLFCNKLANPGYSHHIRIRRTIGQKRVRIFRCHRSIQIQGSPDRHCICILLRQYIRTGHLCLCRLHLHRNLQHGLSALGICHDHRIADTCSVDICRPYIQITRIRVHCCNRLVRTFPQNNIIVSAFIHRIQTQPDYIAHIQQIGSVNRPKICDGIHGRTDRDIR